MAEEKNTIIPKDLVKAWIEKTMQKEYSFTIYPKDRPFGEKFFSYLDLDENNPLEFKRKISEDIGEITQVWNCGYKKRILAHSKGVYSWRDPKFNSKLTK